MIAIVTNLRDVIDPIKIFFQVAGSKWQVAGKPFQYSLPLATFGLPQNMFKKKNARQALPGDAEIGGSTFGRAIQEENKKATHLKLLSFIDVAKSRLANYLLGVKGELIVNCEW